VTPGTVSRPSGRSTRCVGVIDVSACVLDKVFMALMGWRCRAHCDCLQQAAPQCICTFGLACSLVASCVMIFLTCCSSHTGSLKALHMHCLL
jgi:hypothetical protein